jgi:Zn-dependent peptidase ImmA (M78 family)
MANRLNTVAKGNMFEDMVFAKMKELLESDDLGLLSKHSKIFQKKAYAGKSGNNIIFDIAIESYHSDSNECSTLTLIECKDYNSPIEVEKLRDFAYRIGDVGGNKGYFITTSNFQKGAIQIAESHRIGLAKFNACNLEIDKWVLRRSGYTNYQRKQSIRDEICSPNSNAIPYDFVAVYDSHCYSNFLDFVAEQIFGEMHKISVPYLSDDIIESKVNCLDLLQYQSYPLISTEILLNIISNQIGFRLLQHQILPFEDLGACDFLHKTISVSETLSYNSPRWRFTVAHEIGHYILHKSICSQNRIDTISDDDTSINGNIGNQDLSRLEIQANKFASHLLLPNKPFFNEYGQIHKKLDIPRFPHLYLDNQPCNRRDCLQIFSYLGNVFNVSKEVIKIRLQEMNLLTIDESTKSLRNIIGS